MFKFDCFAKWIEKSITQRTGIANPDQHSFCMIKEVLGIAADSFMILD